jgi:SAM-dependent methyltransferase
MGGKRNGPGQEPVSRSWNWKQPSQRHGGPWNSSDLETIRRRYRWLAPIYPLFELLWWLPSGIRRRAVDRLKLTNGERVAEIGYGTGRNLRHLVAAVGSDGKVYAVDCCEEMLAKTVKLRDRAGWDNVVPLLQDAAQLSLPEMVDGVLFSLSYSVIPDPAAALTAAWKASAQRQEARGDGW